MYFSYSYYSMKPKPGMLRYSSVSSTSQSDYNDWKNQMEGYSWRNWPKLSTKLAEDVQGALLRGMTVIGIGCSDWDSLFGDVYHEYSPFQGMAKAFPPGQAVDWRYFAKKIALETYKSNHYPVNCPEWLFPYGYSQKLYLQDLAVYWDNIHEDYFLPWETTRSGQDSPEVVRLKRLGELARQKIDQAARQGSQQLKR
jgi:hypothetical protein